MPLVYKDAMLSRLAADFNVAQFVSVDPAGQIRHVCLFDRTVVTCDRVAALTALMNAAPEHRLNVRSFRPDSPRGHEFIYGIDALDVVLGHAERLNSQGFVVIVNETIDVNDGGVSGVVHGDIIEFAPGDTPRCVEKPGVLTMERTRGIQLLERVYGFEVNVPAEGNQRVEFSLHPIRRGTRRAHIVIWEREELPSPTGPIWPVWPNRFSRFCGDKAFGLLIADTLGLPVPRTMVIPRQPPPFAFGRSTGTGETWLRTCPAIQAPGKYSTHRGWADPFSLVAQEDSEGGILASILAQEGVEAQFAGAVVTDAAGQVVIDGVAGSGGDLMLGVAAPQTLPVSVEARVRETYHAASGALGPVRFEWVFDGSTVWVVQLHRGQSASIGNTIYPGVAVRFHRFVVSDGLEALRDLVKQVRVGHDGIILVGSVGITSHMCDLLRLERIPSRLERE